MITRNLFTSALLLLLPLGFIACTKTLGPEEEEPKEPQHLEFSTDSIQVRLNYRDMLIPLRGNGLYNVSTEDTSILKVYAMGFETGSGYRNTIYLEGRQKGRTSIQVKDLISNDSVDLKVRVTDFHNCLPVEDSNHPLFELRKDTLVLVSNDSKDFYLLKSGDQEPIKGHYLCTVEDNIPYLTFSYMDQQEQEMVYKFSILGNEEMIYLYLQKYYGLSLPANKSKVETRDINRSKYLNMQDENGKEVHFFFDPSKQVSADLLEN